jgi:hypothetical protein
MTKHNVEKEITRIRLLPVVVCVDRFDLLGCIMRRVFFLCLHVESAGKLWVREFAKWDISSFWDFSCFPAFLKHSHGAFF